jgi:hypothetical protein
MTSFDQKKLTRPRRKRSKIAKFLNSTSRRTFFILPLFIFLAEVVIQNG